MFVYGIFHVFVKRTPPPFVEPSPPFKLCLDLLLCFNLYVSEESILITPRIDDDYRLPTIVLLLSY